MTDYTPSVDTTFFPRVNYYRTFAERLQARINNGRVAMFFNRTFRISGATTVALVEDDTAVATYTANRTVDTWSLTGANAALFSIDSNGVVTSAAPAAVGSYVYIVNAASAGEPTATLAVNVVVSAGPDVTAPVVSGGTNINVSTGDTAVATYTADESVTWSLTGTNASLFSISAGGVVTFDSASTDGTYNFTVNATDAAGNVGTLAVTVNVSAAVAPTFVAAASDRMTTITSAHDFTLSGLQSGDVVFLHINSDSNIEDTFIADTPDIASWTYLTSPEIPTEGGTASYDSNFGNGVWWKVATGTSMTVNLADVPTAETNNYGVTMIAFRGVDNTDPVSSERAYHLSNGNSITGSDFTSPFYETISVAYYTQDDDNGCTITPATGYTEAVAVSANTGTSVSNGSTQSCSYRTVPAQTSLSGRTWTASTTDAAMMIEFLLVPAGQEGVNPNITSSQTTFIDAAGGTAVGTFTADESVTWALSGGDAALFDISAGGVITYKSASAVGAYNFTVIAIDAGGLTDAVDVSVKAYTTGTPGGGITLVDSDQGFNDTTAGDTLTLTGLQAGDFMVLTYASDAGSQNSFQNLSLIHI